MPVPDPAHRLRRRGGLRDPLPGRARRAPLGRAAGGRRRRTGCGRSGSSRSGCCGSQKMHILVGQDTDSESTPFGAAMPWIVKLDKDQDFIGKWALEQRRGTTASRPTLVGFTLANGHVPTEGAVVLARRRRPGRAGHERALLAAARRRDRHGLGAGRRWRRTAPRVTISDEGKRLEADGGHDGPSTTPTARCCAREPRVPLAAESALARSPMEREARAAGRAARAARRLERGRRLSTASEPERALPRVGVGFADRSHLGKIELQADPADLRARSRGARWRSARPRTRADDAWWCPYAPDARARALRAGRHGGAARPRSRRRPRRAPDRPAWST